MFCIHTVSHRVTDKMQINDACCYKTDKITKSMYLRFMCFFLIPTQNIFSYFFLYRNLLQAFGGGGGWGEGVRGPPPPPLPLAGNAYFLCFFLFFHLVFSMTKSILLRVDGAPLRGAPQWFCQKQTNEPTSDFNRIF